MSAVYVGNLAFQETVGSVLNVDPWGMDRLTRRIVGRADQGPAYLRTLGRKRNVRDSVYTSLFMVDYAINMDGALWTADLNFTGIIGAAIPDPYPTSGTKTLSVNIPFVIDALGGTNGITASFSYVAPWTRIDYVLNYEPQQPKYPGLVRVTNNSFTIVERTGAAGGLAIYKGQSINSQTAADAASKFTSTPNIYNAVAESYGTIFDYIQVGQWWRCTEVNEARLIPLDLANAGYLNEINL